jgi:hypothetical protein
MHYAYQDSLSKVNQRRESEVCDPSWVETEQSKELFTAASPEANLANFLYHTGKTPLFQKRL